MFFSLVPRQKAELRAPQLVVVVIEMGLQYALEADSLSRKAAIDALLRTKRPNKDAAFQLAFCKVVALKSYTYL